jgi:hypothetical protein
MVSTVISYFYIFINYEIQVNDDIVMKLYLFFFFFLFIIEGEAGAKTLYWANTDTERQKDLEHGILRV